MMNQTNQNTGQGANLSAGQRTLRPEESTRMFAEAGEAATAVRAQFAANASAARALGERLRRRPPSMILTCGRGSSDHAATYAKYLFETRAGVLTASAAPSISSVYAAEPRAEGALCLAISQSGKSPDLLAAVEAAKRAGAEVVALVNVERSPLAALADEVLPLCAGPELSVAATKSYIAALAAVLQVCAYWTEAPDLLAALETVPDLLAQAWKLDWSAAAEQLYGARDLYVVGRGLGFGAAQEMALKFKETCGLHAEAFSSAEVRHGPMALVEPGFPVLAIGQDDETRAGLEAVVKDLAARGGEVIAAGLDCPGALALPTLGAHPAVQPLLEAQSFYRMVNLLSTIRGYDPDRPPHLAKVTETV
jgi:glucosamine--fructose-6-phosphate aminotransferase (isomerizing)